LANSGNQRMSQAVSYGVPEGEFARVDGEHAQEQPGMHPVIQFRKIFSIAFPFANSSISLSK
jgi:hypothetical protein